ncbi:hypothetical protein NEOKW01_1337 [Nematocida sp. AWRm80]|nr:hypothetical protein NEOKW01_1337 [Nematocida sp. AWRm80]
MATGTTEDKVINSNFIQVNIIKILDSFKDKSATFNEILSKIKQPMALSFIDYLSKDSPIIKEEAFNEDIRLYKYGIFSAIEIAKEIGDNSSDSLLNKFMAKPQMAMTDEEKDSLVKALEQQISQQQSDLILGLWDVRERLVDKEDIMNRFDDLATACSESSEMVKACIIDKLESVIKEINKKNIKDIDYKNIDSIEEIEDTKEILEKWDTIIPPSQIIIAAEHLFIDSRLKSKSIKKDIRQQTDLKYGLRYFKTVANHLPELVNKKHKFPRLSTIHSDENSFFKKFTRSALKEKTLEQLAKDINNLYNKASEDPENRTAPEEHEDTSASNQNPSLLEVFKSLSPQIRLLIVLVTVIVAIAASLLLFYSLESKEAGHQIFV